MCRGLVLIFYPYYYNNLFQQLVIVSIWRASQSFYKKRREKISPLRLPPLRLLAAINCLLLGTEDRAIAYDEVARGRSPVCIKERFSRRSLIQHTLNLARALTGRDGHSLGASPDVARRIGCRDNNQ